MTVTPTPLDLDALAALAEAATPGPWHAFFKHKYEEHHVSVPQDGGEMRLTLFDNGCPTTRPEEDCAFIAASREAIPQLIARLTALQSELQAKDRALGEIAALDIVPLDKVDGETLDVTAAKLFYERWSEILRIARAALAEKETGDGG